MLFMPATAESIVGLVEETAGAAEELSSIVNVMKAPPMPFLPTELHGQPIVMVLLAHCGSLEDASKSQTVSGRSPIPSRIWRGR